MKKIIYILIAVLAFVKVTKAQTELVSTGTGAAYALSYPAAFTYSSGITITFKAHTVNTGAATLNINGLGTKDIFKNVTTPLAFGDIASNQFVTVIYDGTKFQLTTPVSSSSSPSWALAGNAGTTSAANFIGTTDAVDLVFRTNNTERLRFLVNGNVGIGTATPNTLLTVHHVNNSQLRLSTSSLGTLTTDGLLFDLNNTAGSINLYENLPLHFATAGSNKMTLTAAGNLGLGTSAPATKFHLRGIDVATALLQNADQIIDKDRVIAQLNFSDALTTDPQASINVIRDEESSNASDLPTAITFSTVKDGNDASALTERMRINTAGWVGIGTTVPQDMLSVGSLSPFMVGDDGNIRSIRGVSYTWPNTQAAGFLQNDGTGALSFAALPTNPWTKSGSSIFQTTLADNVGIGTNAPGKIAGVSRYLTIAQGDSYNSQNVSLELQGSTVTGTNGSVSRIDFINYNGLTNHLARVEAKTGSSSNNGRLVFSTHDGTSLIERMKIMNDGKIGVGLGPGTNPSSMLDVNGDFALQQGLAPDGAFFAPLDATGRSLMNMNALTANFEIRSIRGTGDGKVLTIMNPASFIMSIRDQSSGFGLATERIITGTGGTVSYPGPCVVTLVYNTTSSRWFISSVATGASNANLWSKTGASTYLTNTTDFVGIGTSSPQNHLSVFRVNDANMSLSTQGAAAADDISFNFQTLNNATGSLSMGVASTKGWALGARGNAWTTLAEQNMFFAAYWDGTAWKQPLNLLPSGNVGIGTTNPANTRLYVAIPSTDATNNAALTIDNNYTGGTVKYGIDVNVDGAGSGSKYGISSSVVGLAADASAIYGYQVNMVPNGAGTSHGLYSVTSAVGTGIRYGIYNIVSNAAGNPSTMYGIRNSLSGGTGYKYGIYNAGEDGNYFSGDLGLGVTTPVVKLDVNGSMALRKPVDVNLGAGAQINPATTSYVRFTGSGGTYTLGSPSILNGTIAGQMLIITSNHGGTTIIQNSATVRLAGGLNYSMGGNDSLTLIWDGVAWIELSRPNNQ